MLFVDGGANKVGIGTNSAQASLTVAGGAPAASSPATYSGTIQINETALSTLQEVGGLEFRGAVFGSGYGSKITSTDTGHLLFGRRSNNATWSESMRLDGSSGAATFSSSVLGTIINAGSFSSVGIGAVTADVNVAELGPGYLNLGRDDTADAAQIAFSKNGVLHSSIVTDNNDLRIKGNSSNLGIRFDGSDNGSNITALRLDMSAAGAATFNSSVVVNESGADADFRVESDTNTHALFVDAGNNVIGTGTSSPATYVGTGGLAVKGSTVSDLSLVSGGIASGNNSHQMRYWNDTGTAYEIARTRVNVGAGQVNRGEYQFAVNNGGGLRQWLDVDYQGNVTFNEGGNDSDFRVESDGNANMLFVDGGNSHVGMGTATLNRSGLGADHIVLTVGADTEMGMLELQGTRTSDADLGRISFLNAGTRRAEIVAARIDEDTSTKLYFQTSNAGSLGTRLTIGKDGAATFNSSVSTGGDIILPSTGKLYSSGDTDSFLQFNQPNTLRAIIGDSTRMIIEPNTTVFNEDSADVDFRVESDTNTHALFVDAGNSYVNLNSSATPDASVAGFMFTADQLYTSAGAATTLNYQVRFYNGNGLVGAITTDGSATAYLTSSDQRLKENIADADDAGSKIDAIQVRQFDWKIDGSHQDYGMIAQELLEIAPEAVSQPEDPEEMMGVDYSKLVPMMLKEIQSLRARVADLES
jgi:hypothetical protein